MEHGSRRLVDLSFVGERWWPLVTGQAVSAARDPERVTEVDRRYFEICLFSQAVNELKAGDLCIPGSEAYGDYREQLVSWEAYRRDVAAYADQAGVSADAATFVAGLKARLADTAATVDQAFPDNEHVEIVGGEPGVKRLRAKPDIEGLDRLERLLGERMTPVGILEALADTEHWLGWTRHFGPVSGFEAKLDRERYLAPTFCSGGGPQPGGGTRRGQAPHGHGRRGRRQHGPLGPGPPPGRPLGQRQQLSRR